MFGEQVIHLVVCLAKWMVSSLVISKQLFIYLLLFFNYVFQYIYYIYRQCCFLQKNHTTNLCSSPAWILFAYIFPQLAECFIYSRLYTIVAHLKNTKLLKSSSPKSTMKVLWIRMCSLLECLWACWLAFSRVSFRCKSLFVSLALRSKLSKRWP